VLTRRNVDPGALINSGAQATGKELFDIARVDPIRVYVSVPQAYAPSMKVGVKAVVTLQEFPARSFWDDRSDGRRDRSCHAHLEYGSGCSQQRWQAVAGLVRQVHFATGTSVPRITIPVNAMLFRAEGAQVALVDRTARCICARSALDATSALRWNSGGIEVSDQIVINPPTRLKRAAGARRQGQCRRCALVKARPHHGDTLRCAQAGSGTEKSELMISFP